MPLNSKDVIKSLQKEGWEIVDGGKGSHTKLKKNGKMTIIPNQREMKTGLVKAIEKQTGVKLF